MTHEGDPGARTVLESQQVAARRMATRIANAVIEDGRGQQVIEMVRESVRDGGVVRSSREIADLVFPDFVASVRVKINAVGNVLTALMPAEERAKTTLVWQQNLGIKNQKELNPTVAARVRSAGGQGFKRKIANGEITRDYKAMVISRGRQPWSPDEIRKLLELVRSPDFKRKSYRMVGHPNWGGIAQALKSESGNTRTPHALREAYKKYGNNIPKE